jgi:hypothetical protein
MIKKLFAVSAAIEAGAGLALAVWPSAVAVLLLGSSLDTYAALTLGRVAGAALFTLGVHCWLGRNEEQSGAANGLVSGMLLYNTAVAAILAYAGIGLGLRSVGLWPAVVLHAGMAFWCIACLRSKRVKVTS